MAKSHRQKVVACSADTVQMKFLHYIDNADTEPLIDVVLAQCLPKGDKMEYIVQKAVELGVKSIVPVVSQHCVVNTMLKRNCNANKNGKKLLMKQLNIAVERLSQK